jgi:hypothetical protein
MRRCLISACLLAFFPVLAYADDVFLKGGGKVSGRILARTPTSIEMDIGAGRVTLSMNSVLRVEEGRSPLHDYDERFGAMRAGDRDGWARLARWADSEGLGTQARRAWEQVLTIDPSHPEANRALGRVELDGRWMTEAESYRARGYVPFEGGWITPVELDTVLRQRAAAAEAERIRLDAERRVLEAEARALEAEARAREAAYQPVLVAPTIPGWYGGWGGKGSWDSWSSWSPWSLRSSWSGLVSWNNWGPEPLQSPWVSKGGRPSRPSHAGSSSGRSSPRQSGGSGSRGGRAGGRRK